MREVRCKKCNKLLAKLYDNKTGYIIINPQDGTIRECTEPPKDNKKYPFDLETLTRELLESFAMEIKCPRCGEMNTNKKESVENER
jgi:phage FluMu protein Com